MMSPEARHPVDAKEPTDMLAGMRVLDLTTGGTLLAGRLLADLGADVIVVKPPAGNPTRAWAPFWHDQAGPDTSLFWLAYSQSKRSVTIDIQHANGQELFRHIQENALLPPERILFLTGDKRSQLKEFLDSTGCYYLYKPIQFLEFSGHVQAVLSREANSE